MFVGAGEVLEDGEALGVDQLHRAVLINAGQREYLTGRVEPVGKKIYDKKSMNVQISPQVIYLGGQVHHSSVWLGLGRRSQSKDNVFSKQH